MPAMPPGLRRLSLVLLASLSLGACARPYKGPKTLGAVGAVLLGGGAAMWAVGDRQDRRTLATAGVATALAGAAAALAAGGWLAASAACIADPDCPEGEACKEIPAPPGREPYKQCMRR
jgi:hypothetical protein